MRPWSYGFAWRDLDTACMVAYPIPFNVLFRGLRRFWHWIVGGYKNSVIDEARIEGIREGQRMGDKAAWAACEHHQKSYQLRLERITARIDELATEKALATLNQVMEKSRDGEI